MKVIGKNWTDRQMYDFLLGTDPFPGILAGAKGVLLTDGHVEVYDNAEDMFDMIRESIYEDNRMDDPYAPMRPFYGSEKLAPGEVYWLYNVLHGEGFWIVHNIAAKGIYRITEPKTVDEYFCEGNLVGIGNGWCVLRDEDNLIQTLS